MSLYADLKSTAMKMMVLDFAVGGCHSYQEADMREAMHIADEKMYFDKENYYVKFPERRR